MAESGDLKSLVMPFSAYSSAGGTTPFAYIPASHGAITVLTAYIQSIGLGTIVTAELMKLTHVGTPAVGAAGTLGTLPTASGTLVAGAVVALTLATKIVSPGTAGCWLGVAIKGTIVSPINLCVNYIEGRNG